MNQKLKTLARPPNVISQLSCHSQLTLHPISVVKLVNRPSCLGTCWLNKLPIPFLKADEKQHWPQMNHQGNKTCVSVKI